VKGINNTYTHPRLTALYRGLPGWAGTRKAKTNLDFTEARDGEWQWHQLGHMQVCTSLQADNHASTPPLSFYRPDALPVTQPTVSMHWRHKGLNNDDNNKRSKHARVWWPAWGRRGTRHDSLVVTWYSDRSTCATEAGDLRPLSRSPSNTTHKSHHQRRLNQLAHCNVM